MDYFWKHVLYTKKKKLRTEERKSSFFKKKRRNKLDVIIFSLKRVRKTKQSVVDGNVFFHFTSTEDVWCLFSLSLSLRTHVYLCLVSATQTTKQSIANRTATTHKATKHRKGWKQWKVCFFLSAVDAFFYVFLSKFVGGGVSVCVSREDKKKQRKNVYFNISVNFDWCSLSLIFCVTFQKCFCVFYVFCEDRERLKI